jgi:hypothetical protein
MQIEIAVKLKDVKINCIPNFQINCLKTLETEPSESKEEIGY